MLKERDMVMVTTHNFFGKVIYVGDGKIEKINRSKHGIEYIVRCDDGIPRSVAQNDKRFPKDSIMLM